ncbi:rab-GTPase-TBC domain-containing protein [Mycena pura]|uniref:Rab-GTPase-TBC domain-containing protein n=1 Tax=Mycena pura TaxID=153505 RepID=A0AAD6YN42_9AGAR|nr:rab-GTPase-TBC domain-containing protein [Mycena pura]
MDFEKAPLDDWEEYRSMSLSPGGFGYKRTDIWPLLLHAQPRQSCEMDSPSHPDERQIRLDTERSFVLYPVDSEKDKDTLQSELHDLLVMIFRRRPKLNYFQGYHDIVTVLLLTLPPELQLSCAEQLSLQRVRDSMGSTLEPVLGLLRVMKNLMRMADCEYAELLERTSPLPYYALPNLLTLFSHDMPTLPLIQHVFDYLLCRPPIFVVYLATAIVLSRKQDVARLEEEGEEGMLHSLLSALPDVVDDNIDTLTAEAHIEQESLDPMITAKEQLKDLPLLGTLGVAWRGESLEFPVTVDDHNIVEPDGHLSSAEPELPSLASVEPSDNPFSAAELPSFELPNAKTEVPLDASGEEGEAAPPLQHNRRKPTKPTPQSLTAILTMADALHREHPPTHPSLHLSSIMGPQSVIFTWSPRASDMPADDEAERMVQRLDLIVYPEHPPPSEHDNEKRARQRGDNRPKSKVSGSAGLLVGAGIVLGVAIVVSVYGGRQVGEPVRDLRKVGQWVGGFLAGASERVVRFTA